MNTFRLVWAPDMQNSTNPSFSVVLAAYLRQFDIFFGNLDWVSNSFCDNPGLRLSVFQCFWLINVNVLKNLLTQEQRSPRASYLSNPSRTASFFCSTSASWSPPRSPRSLEGSHDSNWSLLLENIFSDIYCEYFRHQDRVKHLEGSQSPQAFHPLSGNNPSLLTISLPAPWTYSIFLSTYIHADKCSWKVVWIIHILYKRQFFIVLSLIECSLVSCSSCFCHSFQVIYTALYSCD